MGRSRVIFMAPEATPENADRVFSYVKLDEVAEGAVLGDYFYVGRAAKIHHPLVIFRTYPKIEPGAQIFVPQKPKREGLDIAKAGILVSVLTALITAISVIKR